MRCSRCSRSPSVLAGPPPPTASRAGVLFDPLPYAHAREVGVFWKKTDWTDKEIATEVIGLVIDATLKIVDGEVCRESLHLALGGARRPPAP